MASFTEKQLDALHVLLGLWGEEALVLVGASALGCAMQFRWRQTRDLDLSVLIPVESYPAGLENLAGWRPDARLEQRWHAPGEVPIDFVPIGEEENEGFEIVWPRSGFRMSIVGFRVAFETANLLDLTPNLRIRVATPAAIAILKMVAYLDRPREREKDLDDLTHLLDQYVPIDDDRRFSAAAIDLQLDFEEVSAYQLGCDMADIAGVRESEAVIEFIARTRDDADPAATLARMIRNGPVSWQDSSVVALGRLKALELGFLDKCRIR